MEYSGSVDKECVSMCEAINGLPGLKTIGSCCGHGALKFCVDFVAEESKYLPALIYYLDACHCGLSGWRAVVKTDCGMSPVTFCIEGPEGAYEQANHIAELISGSKDYQQARKESEVENE